MQNKKGFTLIELLVVIGIIAILAAIVVIAVNPGRQFAQARDAQRWSDVNALLNAIHQYAVDNDGAVPPDIIVGTTAQVLVGSATTGTPACTAKTPAATYLDLSDELVGTGQTYLTDIPMDPSAETASVTKYYVNKDTNGRIEVGACDPEIETAISVTR